MPSVSKKQHNLMEAVAHSPAFAKKVGIKQSVGQDFSSADKGKKFKGGGMAKSDMKEDSKMDMAQDKAMIKKAMGQHDAQEHKGGKGTKLTLKKGGSANMCGGGKAKKYAAGGVTKEMPDGKKMGSLGLKKGGCAKMARGGGIEIRGKTRGKIC